MSIHVFLGPTLPRERARELLPGATFLPPVSQGDVLRSVARRPTAIGIVDGRFHDVPAVWHKEILWALSRGIAVYGSASMGALRAAELAAFGMRGVGEIFAAYHDGTINGDDEVAVAHASADDGYRAVNEAMVNIRATLALAERQRVIRQDTADALIERAKDAYYLERSYARLLLDGATAGLPGGELDALRAWLPEHRVNQKVLDAEAMLREVAAAVEPPECTFTFEHTSFFEQARQTAGEVGGDPGPDPDDDPATVNALEILEELRLEPERHRSVWERAALRACVDAAHPEAPSDLPAAAAAFRRARGLISNADTRAWLDANGLDVDHFGMLVGVERLVTETIERLGEMMPLAVLDLLRADGDYPALCALVVAKRAALAEHGPDDGNDHAAQDVRWYFDLIGKPVPGSLEDHWRPLGFADHRSFLRAVRAEHRYRTLASHLEGRKK